MDMKAVFHPWIRARRGVRARHYRTFPAVKTGHRPKVEV
jgi:hypothetical protein